MRISKIFIFTLMYLFIGSNIIYNAEKAELSETEFSEISKIDFRKTDFINVRLLIINKSPYDIEISFPTKDLIQKAKSLMFIRTPNKIRFNVFGSFSKTYTYILHDNEALSAIDPGKDIVLEIVTKTRASRWVPMFNQWKTNIRILPRTEIKDAIVLFPVKHVQTYAVFFENPKSKKELEDKAAKLFKHKELGQGFCFSFNRVGYINANEWGIQPYYNINNLLLVGRLFFYFDKMIKMDASKFSCDKFGDIFKVIISNYKIHLMPKTEEIPRYFKEILEMINKDPKMRSAIGAFKAIVLYTDKLYKDYGAPKIVLYVYGKNNAQYVLDKVYDKFKHVKGCGDIPAYNEKVTDFIFFSQGDRSDKNMGYAVYEEPGKVYYDRNKLYEYVSCLFFEHGMEYDMTELLKESFHLKNPSKSE